MVTGLLYAWQAEYQPPGASALLLAFGVILMRYRPGFQLDLLDFFPSGIQCHGSEGYLVVGGKGLYGALLGELAGEFSTAPSDSTQVMIVPDA